MRHPNLWRGWWCSREWPHDGPCALRPRWWNLAAQWRFRGAGSVTEDESTWRKPLSLRWWEFRSWFHRCPECKHRPDRHHDSIGPRWENDKIAQMLGIGQYGCRRCGHGSITERDAAAPTPEARAETEGGGRG